MIYIELVCLLLLWVYCAVQLMLLYQQFAYKKQQLLPIEAYPSVSVLIPARNEASNIALCLESLSKLNYPPEKLFILVGDDSSSDNTYQLALEWKSKFQNFECIKVNQVHGQARAKANVIEHLMQYVETDLVCITDADIQVNPNWLQALLPELDTVAMTSGITIVKGQTFFGKMQSFEWLLGFSNLFGFEKMGLPSTAVGNNMAFTKAAYLATGGYANIAFSVTEDLALTMAFRSHGYQNKTICTTHALNISAAQYSFKSLLHQRKRWLIGGSNLPAIWKCIFLLQALFLPALIAVAFVNFKLALFVFLVKAVLQCIQIFSFSRQISFQITWYLLPLFIVYQEIIAMATVFFYVLPLKMNWKQRTYSIKNEPIN